MQKSFIFVSMNAWLKRTQGPDELVSIVQYIECRDAVLVYRVCTAFEINPDYLGRILFDVDGWTLQSH